jgi:hypothetical protein
MSGSRRTFLPVGLALSALLCACASEITITEGTPRPVPTPLPPDEDPNGDPPDDWESCASGFLGRYYNLELSNPAVEPVEPSLPPDTVPADLNWWNDDDFAFDRFDPALDFGTGWWPVDTGLEGDPAYFTVSWVAWLRTYTQDPVTISLGSADDAWVLINGEEVAARPGLHDFSVDTITWTPPRKDQFPIEVYYAHRAAEESGFRLLVTGGNTALCYPDFEE